MNEGFIELKKFISSIHTLTYIGWMEHVLSSHLSRPAFCPPGSTFIHTSSRRLVWRTKQFPASLLVYRRVVFTDYLVAQPRQCCSNTNTFLVIGNYVLVNSTTTKLAPPAPCCHIKRLSGGSSSCMPASCQLKTAIPSSVRPNGVIF